MLITIGNHISKARIGSKLNLEPEIITYLTGLSTPLSAGQVGRLNKFVRDLKAGLSISALSDAFDVMYILANETAESGLRNLVKRAHDAQAINAPAFTVLEGFKGNGISSYINTNYNPASNGIQYTINSASFGAYVRIMHSDGAKTLYGSIDGSNPLIRNMPNRSAGKFFGINGPAVVDLGANINSLGVYVLTRSASNVVNLYLNKNTERTKTDTSNSIPGGNIYLLAENKISTTSVGEYSEAQMSFAFGGKHITTQQRDVIVDAIEAYMDSNGKGVIS